MSAISPAGTHAQLQEVSNWVARFAPLIKPGGRVLDLACGGGRHARYLAARGCLVEAVDRDAEALLSLTREPGITVRHADLEGGSWPYADSMFDAIVVTNYLYRPLLPLLGPCLGPAGLLIYETFARGNESYGRPSNPEFLLAPGELLALAGQVQLRVLAYEDGYVDLPKPAMVQRMVALKPPVALGALQLMPVNLPEAG
jgi:SAM-dependent methyltransferase